MKFASSSSEHPRTVFIGSEPLLAAWNACGGQESQVIAVPLTDLTFAIDLINEAEPEVVIIEQAVAASAPGATLMDRLHNERYLRGILQSYELEVQRIKDEHVAAYRSAIEPDLRRLGIE